MKTLVKYLFALTLAPLSWGQFKVTFTPVQPAAADVIFANAKTVNIYQIAVCADDPNNPMPIRREKILNAVPQIPVLLNAIAEDLLVRKAAASKWALVARYGGLIAQYAPTGLALYGAATGTPNLTKIGLASSVGLEVGKLALDRASSRAPDPGKYFEKFLPDFVTLAGNGGCNTYLAAASIMGKAVVVGPVHVDETRLVAKPVAFASPDVRAIWKAAE